MKTPRYWNYLPFLFVALVTFFSCEPDDYTPEKDPENEYTTGTDYEMEQAGAPYVPMDLSLVTLSDATAVSGSMVSLEPWVPPVRSQGAYGTCTAWACGYYARTIMYARENDLSKADLENAGNVFSPLDLFLSMDGRGVNCRGSWPGEAFSVMQNRGIATLATAPYENLGNCSGSPLPDWNNEAGNYKIEKYRRVDPENIEALKSYIQLGRPIQVSCYLGLNFRYIDDGSVWYEDDYSGSDDDHDRHAMVIVGYDDDKGANGAFRIVNSWGPHWGDDGYFWVDYNFFAQEFCYAAYIIDGDKGGLSDAVVDGSVINPNYRVDGKDLLAVQLIDEYDDYPGNPPNARALTYNVFNRGLQPVPASNKWNIVYYYYNAYNPENDFGIIIYDYFTNEVGAPGQHGDFNELPEGVLHPYGQFNWWNNVDIPSGYSAATAVYGHDGYDYDFLYYYQVPDITGEYYFVLYADGFNTIGEQFEQNNFMFFTGENQQPLTLVNGVIQESGLKSGPQTGAFPMDMKDAQPNAYDIDEISALVQHQKKEGILDKKAQEYRSTSRSVNQQGRGYTGKGIIRARLLR
ncbi:MAG: C1 family peptidase [Bacteroidota bacterium]